MPVFVRDAINNCYDVVLSVQDVPTTLKLGGGAGKFVPNLNLAKWNDECWLNINHPDVVGAEKETLSAGKVSLQIGDLLHRYSLTENNLEYEIIFSNKPSNYEVTLYLDFPEGLQFLYQGELTQKEIDFGIVRPENVIGSYAVYWHKRNNQYKTGKFCHIYRPKLKDAGGVEIWATMRMESKQLIITCPKDWMDQALYPVILDPNLGTTGFGGSAEYLSNAAVITNSYQMGAEAGTISKFFVHVNSFGGGTGYKMGLYNAAQVSDYNPNGQTLVEQVSAADANDNSWNEIVGAGGALAANTWYAIGIIATPNNEVAIDCDTGSAYYSKYTGLTYANEMLATRDTRDDWNGIQLSIYVEYTTAGPPPAVNPLRVLTSARWR